MSSIFPAMTRPSAVSEAQQWVSELTMSIAVTVFVAVVTVLVVLFFGIWKFKSKVLPSQSEAPRRYRFRKRDKVLFFGRKMLRKVKSFTRNTVGPSASGGMGRRKPSHKLMISRLRRFLAQRKDSSKPRLKQQSPPQSFLEADWSDIEDDHRLPPEVLYMLRSVRVFGHLEKPFFIELCRYMETITLRAGNFLFKIGDPDDSIYVVQHGLLEVYITDSDGTEHLVKHVATGASIHSLLSILDVLTGHPGAFRSVSARAVTDSTILRLPAHAFKSMFEKFNESAVKVVQIIMIRLQRVTFSALHNYLGLSKELLKPEGHGDTKELNIHRINRSTNSPNIGSPAKVAGAQGSGTGTGPESGKEELEGKGATSGTPHKKPIVLGRPLSDTATKMSDFDAALLRARASITDEKSIVLSGSPPRRLSTVEHTVSDPSPSSSYRSRTLPDEEIVLSMAAKDLVQILGLKDPSLLEGRISLSFVRAGSIFCKQGDQDTNLFFLVKGTVSVLQNVVGESSKEALMFHAEPGEIIDVLAVLTGEPSFFTMRAKSDAAMVVITKPDFYQIMRVEPFIVLNVAHCTVKRMSSFVRQIDFALDWQMLEAGKALFRQGDPSESIFIVLTGRLRSVITTLGGKKELVGEFGRGELVGIVEVLTQHERATTVLAIRDTELTKIPSELLHLIKLRYPQVVARLIHLLGTRILGNIQQRNTVNLTATVPIRSDSYEKIERSTVDNLATIAIVPVTEDVPLTNFALELQHALLNIGPTVRLTPDIVKSRLGTDALEGVNEFRLFSWLSQQEDIHRMVLYQCDYQLTKWSKHCLRQADCILIVGLADKEPTIGPIEQELENIAVRAQKELILLYKDDAETPRNTTEWLNVRGWLSSHHHIRCHKRVLKSKSAAKTLETYERLFKTQADRMTDFSRLARFLTGNSIGLVLGGGGARGLAHVGMIKAMQEAGIPIDMIGGTSMGSFIGALWAEERNYVRFTQRAREWSVGMSSLWKKIWDLTYPVASMFTGWAFNESIENVFHDRQIEDLWIPYFCVTTNISSSSMRVHSLGSVWRYVRASMSLSGYLPPLCDPVDGHLLLDGGYVNNLPADVMHKLGAKFVFAVDVGSQDETDLTNYGDSLSGWWLLWKRWNPWAKPVRVPDMTEIQSRLAYVSCVRQLEVVKNSDYCEYIRPPIDRYATLQFGSYDEIVETGYHHGKTLFTAWSKGGLLDKLFQETEPPSNEARAHKERNLQKSHVPVMAYFTDLAEQVSKIEKPKSKFYLNDESEEEVIDENDEDEDPGLLMEGYEEDDEFANSDGDDVSEDGEEAASERRKVKSVIKPLYNLGFISKVRSGVASADVEVVHMPFNYSSQREASQSSGEQSGHYVHGQGSDSFLTSTGSGFNCCSCSLLLQQLEHNHALWSARTSQLSMTSEQMEADSCANDMVPADSRTIATQTQMRSFKPSAVVQVKMNLLGCDQKEETGPYNMQDSGKMGGAKGTGKSCDICQEDNEPIACGGHIILETLSQKHDADLMKECQEESKQVAGIQSEEVQICDDELMKWWLERGSGQNDGSKIVTEQNRDVSETSDSVSLEPSQLLNILSEESLWKDSEERDRSDKGYMPKISLPKQFMSRDEFPNLTSRDALISEGHVRSKGESPFAQWTLTENLFGPWYEDMNLTVDLQSKPAPNSEMKKDEEGNARVVQLRGSEEELVKKETMMGGKHDGFKYRDTSEEDDTSLGFKGDEQDIQEMAHILNSDHKREQKFSQNFHSEVFEIHAYDSSDSIEEENWADFKEVSKEIETGHEGRQSGQKEDNEGVGSSVKGQRDTREDLENVVEVCWDAKNHEKILEKLGIKHSSEQELNQGASVKFSRKRRTCTKKTAENSAEVRGNKDHPHGAGLYTSGDIALLSQPQTELHSSVDMKCGEQISAEGVLQEKRAGFIEHDGYVQEFPTTDVRHQMPSPRDVEHIENSPHNAQSSITMSPTSIVHWPISAARHARECKCRSGRVCSPEREAERESSPGTQNLFQKPRPRSVEHKRDGTEKSSEYVEQHTHDQKSPTSEVCHQISSPRGMEHKRNETEESSEYEEKTTDDEESVISGLCHQIPSPRDVEQKRNETEESSEHVEQNPHDTGVSQEKLSPRNVEPMSFGKSLGRLEQDTYDEESPDAKNCHKMFSLGSVKHQRNSLGKLLEQDTDDQESLASEACCQIPSPSSDECKKSVLGKNPGHSVQGNDDQEFPPTEVHPQIHSQRSFEQLLEHDQESQTSQVCYPMSLGDVQHERNSLYKTDSPMLSSHRHTTFWPVVTAKLVQNTRSITEREAGVGSSPFKDEVESTRDSGQISGGLGNIKLVSDVSMKSQFGAPCRTKLLLESLVSVTEEDHAVQVASISPDMVSEPSRVAGAVLSDGHFSISPVCSSPTEHGDILESAQLPQTTQALKERDSQDSMTTEQPESQTSNNDTSESRSTADKREKQTMIAKKIYKEFLKTLEKKELWVNDPDPAGQDNLSSMKKDDEVNDSEEVRKQRLQEFLKRLEENEIHKPQKKTVAHGVGESTGKDPKVDSYSVNKSSRTETRRQKIAEFVLRMEQRELERINRNKGCAGKVRCRSLSNARASAKNSIQCKSIGTGNTAKPVNVSRQKQNLTGSAAGIHKETVQSCSTGHSKEIQAIVMSMLEALCESAMKTSASRQHLSLDGDQEQCAEAKILDSISNPEPMKDPKRPEGIKQNLNVICSPKFQVVRQSRSCSQTSYSRQHMIPAGARTQRNRWAVSDSNIVKATNSPRIHNGERERCHCQDRQSGVREKHQDPDRQNGKKENYPDVDEQSSEKEGYHGLDKSSGYLSDGKSVYKCVLMSKSKQVAKTIDSLQPLLEKATFDRHLCLGTINNEYITWNTGACQKSLEHEEKECSSVKNEGTDIKKSKKQTVEGSVNQMDEVRITKIKKRDPRGDTKDKVQGILLPGMKELTCSRSPPITRGSPKKITQRNISMNKAISAPDSYAADTRIQSSPDRSTSKIEGDGRLNFRSNVSGSDSSVILAGGGVMGISSSEEGIMRFSRLTNSEERIRRLCRRSQRLICQTVAECIRLEFMQDCLQRKLPIVKRSRSFGPSA